jgi:hypothetical protein
MDLPLDGFCSKIWRRQASFPKKCGQQDAAVAAAEPLATLATPITKAQIAGASRDLQGRTEKSE